MGLSGRKSFSVSTALLALRTWVCMSQAWGGGDRKEGLCLVFKPQTKLFQNYPPRGTQKPNTSSISSPLVPDEESLSLPRP